MPHVARRKQRSALLISRYEVLGRHENVSSRFSRSLEPQAHRNSQLQRLLLVHHQTIHNPKYLPISTTTMHPIILLLFLAAGLTTVHSATSSSSSAAAFTTFLTPSTSNSNLLSSSVNPKSFGHHAKSVISKEKAGYQGAAAATGAPAVAAMGLMGVGVMAVL